MWKVYDQGVAHEFYLGPDLLVERLHTPAQLEQAQYEALVHFKGSEAALIQTLDAPTRLRPFTQRGTWPCVDVVTL